MQTNPESAAVEAVAWMGPLGQLIKNDRFQARVNGLPDHGDLSTYTALYPQSALDALRGEVDRKSIEIDGFMDKWAAEIRRADAAERRVAELKAMTGKHELGNGERIECHITVGVNVWRGDRWVSFHQCSPQEFALTLASIKKKNAALTKESP